MVESESSDHSHAESMQGPSANQVESVRPTESLEQMTNENNMLRAALERANGQLQDIRSLAQEALRKSEVDNSSGGSMSPAQVFISTVLQRLR